jgi:hypothetical protein
MALSRKLLELKPTQWLARQTNRSGNHISEIAAIPDRSSESQADQ